MSVTKESAGLLDLGKVLKACLPLISGTILVALSCSIAAYPCTAKTESITS